MERKNDSTILLLVAAGLGIYWYMNKKKKPTDNISTQPVTPQPVTEMPSGTSVPIVDSNWRDQVQNILTDTKVYTKQQDQMNTTVTDMFNSVMTTNYNVKAPESGAYNMNIAPIE
jgi:hypothetical protein